MVDDISLPEGKCVQGKRTDTAVRAEGGVQARPTLEGPRLSGRGKEEEGRGAYKDERGSAAGGVNAEAAATSVKTRRHCGRDGMGLMRRSNEGVIFDTASFDQWSPLHFFGSFWCV